jgi:hypothetical protein
LENRADRHMVGRIRCSSLTVEHEEHLEHMESKKVVMHVLSINDESSIYPEVFD